ncbi:DNA replication complex GINS protein PSF2, partial [Lobulomyces angularis]
MNYVKEEELAFLAENELITVAPTVKLPILYLMGNNYGPFQPPLKEKVPIWLAILLRNRNKCRIVPPEWMKV